jgi:hypothetical protein
MHSLYSGPKSSTAYLFAIVVETGCGWVEAVQVLLILRAYSRVEPGQKWIVRCSFLRTLKRFIVSCKTRITWQEGVFV